MNKDIRLCFKKHFKTRHIFKSRGFICLSSMFPKLFLLPLISNSAQCDFFPLAASSEDIIVYILRGSGGSYFSLGIPVKNNGTTCCPTNKATLYYKCKTLLSLRSEVSEYTHLQSMQMTTNNSNNIKRPLHLHIL